MFPAVNGNARDAVEIGLAREREDFVLADERGCVAFFRGDGIADDLRGPAVRVAVCGSLFPGLVFEQMPGGGDFTGLHFRYGCVADGMDAERECVAFHGFTDFRPDDVVEVPVLGAFGFGIGDMPENQERDSLHAVFAHDRFGNVDVASVAVIHRDQDRFARQEIKPFCRVCDVLRQDRRAPGTPELLHLPFELGR